jgi:alkyl hydroperoxide reductase subunit AhpF
VLLLKPYEPLPGRHSAERKPTAWEDIVMSAKRIVEVFTAGCPVCQGVVEMVNEMACPNCDVTIYNLNRNEGIDEAKAYGVTALPSVAVNGELLACCKRGAIRKQDLKAAGVGQSL